MSRNPWLCDPTATRLNIIRSYTPSEVQILDTLSSELCLKACTIPASPSPVAQLWCVAQSAINEMLSWECRHHQSTMQRQSFLLVSNIVEIEGIGGLWYSHESMQEEEGNVSCCSAGWCWWHIECMPSTNPRHVWDSKSIRVEGN